MPTVPVSPLLNLFEKYRPSGSILREANVNLRLCFYLFAILFTFHLDPVYVLVEPIVRDLGHFSPSTRISSSSSVIYLYSLGLRTGRANR